MNMPPNGFANKVTYNPILWCFEGLKVSANNEVNQLIDKTAEYYRKADLTDCIAHLKAAIKLAPQTPNLFLSLAICLARAGNYQAAMICLDQELKQATPHHFARQFRQDIARHLAPDDVSPPLQPALTIFTTPKSFKGQADIAQRNAIQSWLALEPKPEILLLSDDEGVADVAQEYGIRHVSGIATNEYGTPLISDVFEQAQRAASNELMAYVNTDIIFTASLSCALGALQNQEQFLVVGRRWDVDIHDSLDFSSDWESKLADIMQQDTLLHGSTGIDYFIFKKGLYQKLQPLAVGRTAWDNWLIWEAKRNGAKLIDATHAINAIHQDHSYTHASGGVKEVWRGVEARRNRELVGDHIMTIADAEFCIEQGQVIPMHKGYKHREPTRQDYINFKFRQSVNAFLQGHYDHAFDLLEYIELNTDNCTLPQNYHQHKSKVLSALERRDIAANDKIINETHMPDLKKSHFSQHHKTMRFMQIHTFYQAYLNNLYSRYPDLQKLPYQKQIKILTRDGFSANHMIAPYMDKQGYETHLIIANNHASQAQWLHENNLDLPNTNNWVQDIARIQIETIQPDILYLSDPITFESKFIRSLRWRPRLILGWRAANIPENTDWNFFDVMLSSLSNLRNTALQLGAKSAEHFFPGYPAWINDDIIAQDPVYDVVFAGSWTLDQHKKRNSFLQTLAQAVTTFGKKFSLALYLNGSVKTMPAEVKQFNLGARFGFDMHKALKTGRIIIDARGTIEIKDSNTGKNIDLAGNQTANMRIFEATGCGAFLLTEHFDNITDFFEPGVEIETFRDAEEMLSKIDYYLKHPQEREAIARRGQERCLREYSMERRADAFEQIIRKHMTSESNTCKNTKSVDELKVCAEEQLNTNNTQTAFDLLNKAKALKQPVQGLDLLRAHCFLKMNQHLAAIQALYEELRYFPENGAAKELLNQLVGQQSNVGSLTGVEPEFMELLKVIRPYTMLSEQRLYSLYRLARHVCENNIPGNFVECGVAAGGSSALLAWVLKKYSKQPRKLFAFDSYSGMPEPTAEDTLRGMDAESTGWGTGTCAAPEVSVLSAASKLGVLSLVKPVKGYFEDTLPHMKNFIGPIAFMHMDADWYSSIKTILNNLYDNLSTNALVQLDDYGYWDGCSKALHEFEYSRGLHFAINNIDGIAVWFEKAYNSL